MDSKGSRYEWMVALNGDGSKKRFRIVWRGSYNGKSSKRPYRNSYSYYDDWDSAYKRFRKSVISRLLESDDRFYFSLQELYGDEYATILCYEDRRL